MTNNPEATKADDHYLPWLEEGGQVDGGVARPAPLPTRSTTGAPPITADELLARPMPQAATHDAPGIAARLGAAWAAFVDFTIRSGERWDVPGRVEALELPRRARALMQAGQRASSRTAARTSAIISKGYERGAPALQAGLNSAGSAIGRGGQAVSGHIKAGAAAVADRARAVASDPAPAIESQLDRLIDDDRRAQAPGPQGLPLFNETPTSTAPAPLPMAAAENTPVDTPVAAPAAAPTTAPAMTAAANEAGPSPDASSTNTPSPDAITGGATRPAPRPLTDAPRIGGGGGGRAPIGQWVRHPATMVLGAVALLASGFAAGLYWTGPGVDRASTEVVIHDYLLNHPEILPQAMERLQNNRTASTIATLGSKLTTPFSGAWAGAADGDVTLVMFSDYACTYCRASLPVVDRLLREDPRLKVVFRELPILSRDSEAAARLALVAARQGRYMPMHRQLFAASRPDEAARRAAAIALDVPNDATRLDDPAITRELQSNLDMARQLNFNGTPSWVVGDKMLSGAVGYDALRSAIREARQARR